MKKFLSKLFVGLFALGGVLAMTGCQTTAHNAQAPLRETTVKIMKDEQTGEKIASVVLGITNPTIYNVREVQFTYDVYDAMDQKIGDTIENEPVELFVSHGVSGYLSYIVRIDSKDQYAEASYVKMKDITVSKYDSLWTTYLAPFIVSIVIVAFSLIFFAVEIFRSGWTREFIKQRMREKLASYLVTLCLILIICLIPLMFSSWVTTLILVGAFVASFLLCGIMSLIRMAFIKQ